MDTIGRCEICGLVDHSLDRGLCPECQRKAQDYHPELERLREAAALLVPVAIAAVETGLLTEPMARQVMEVVSRIPGQEEDEPIGYEAAWQGGGR